eukprot:GGOE01043556.1.p1 GENE.GGOE01043556.1~~GGOE01043556.1.p1  ORF type:complete len:221 (-),score=68.34 GGOE01043556.1:247-840(-)
MGAGLWPAARVLAADVLAALAEVSNSGTVCLELGAGAGVPSLAVAVSGHSMVASDGSSAVVELLRRNAALNPKASATLTIHQLDWTDTDDIQAMLNEFPNRFMLICGSDILYHPSDLRPLLNTVSVLLASQQEARFLLAMSTNYFAELAGPLQARAGEAGLEVVRQSRCSPSGADMLQGYTSTGAETVEVFEFRRMS